MLYYPSLDFLRAIVLSWKRSTHKGSSGLQESERRPVTPSSRCMFCMKTVGSGTVVHGVQSLRLGANLRGLSLSGGKRNAEMEIRQTHQAAMCD